jgi:transposase-like protein
MIGFAELEVEGLTGAAYGEKNLDSLVQRNGYRDWTWEMRAGTVELRIPKLREGFIFRAFSNHPRSPRRRSRRSCRRRMCTASRHAQSMTWSGPSA